MIYNNDETDKGIRQKNYLLTVYVLPIFTSLGICSLIYLGSKMNIIPESDTYYGYLISLTPGFILYSIFKKNWLKMPDGTHHNVKGLIAERNVNLNEPTEYEAEFFNSKKNMVISGIAGIALIGMGIWLVKSNSPTILIPIVTLLIGIFTAYSGIKGLLDKSAKLKVATNGLWTMKLGFKNWDEINSAEVVEDKSGRHPQTILEIRLKGTKFEEANQPDERLILNSLENKENIEMIINNSFFKYKQQTTKSSS